jgi:aminoglycoside phosphotransferase (APT) family kinase protein
MTERQFMEQDWGRRHDFVALDESTITSLLQPVFPGKTLASAELLTAGKCNTNYKIRVLGINKFFVLRIHVRDRVSGKRDFSIFQLVQERVPVPQILYTTEGREPGAISYTVMSWVDGILFSDILASKDERAIAECARNIGITLANIGTYTFPKAGFFGPDLSIIEEFDEESTLSYFEQFLFTGQSGQHLGPTLTRRLWNFLKDNVHYFDAINAARSLVHSDFKGFNILVHQLNDRWHVSAVLDWEFAFAGSPLVDIGNMLRYSHLHPAIFEQEFINGYREQGGMLPRDWKKIAKLVDLLSLCEFLNSPTPRDALRQEVTGLIMNTLERWDGYGGQTALSQF